MLRRFWICLGGGLCLSTALIVQRVWGQAESGVPPGLPGLPLPPMTVPALPTVNPTTPIPLPPLPPKVESAPLPTAPPSGSLPASLPIIPTAVVPQTTTSPIELPSIPATPVTSGPLPAVPVTSFKPPELTVETRPGKQEPAVSVEWVGPAQARFNQPMNCQIIIRNNGTAAAPAGYRSTEHSERGEDQDQRTAA